MGFIFSLLDHLLTDPTKEYEADGWTLYHKVRRELEKVTAERDALSKERVTFRVGVAAQVYNDVSTILGRKEDQYIEDAARAVVEERDAFIRDRDLACGERDTAVTQLAMTRAVLDRYASGGVFAEVSKILGRGDGETVEDAARALVKERDDLKAELELHNSGRIWDALSKILCRRQHETLEDAARALHKEWGQMQDAKLAAEKERDAFKKARDFAREAAAANLRERDAIQERHAQYREAIRSQVGPQLARLECAVSVLTDFVHEAIEEATTADFSARANAALVEENRHLLARQTATCGDIMAAKKALAVVQGLLAGAAGTLMGETH